jgi:hypothetical protein
MVRYRFIIAHAILLALGTTLMTGCDNSGNNPAQVIAPPAQIGETNAPLPKEPEKGGGPGSSGNMKTPPGSRNYP